MKKINKSNTVDYINFRFIAWNSPKLNIFTKLVRFNFNKLLDITLMKTVMLEQKYTKKQLERSIVIGIMTGQISVMRLNSNAKYIGDIND